MLGAAVADASADEEVEVVDDTVGDESTVEELVVVLSMLEVLDVVEASLVIVEMVVTGSEWTCEVAIVVPFVVSVHRVV